MRAAKVTLFCTILYVYFLGSLNSEIFFWVSNMMRKVLTKLRKIANFLVHGEKNCYFWSVFMLVSIFRIDGLHYSMSTSILNIFEYPHGNL